MGDLITAARTQIGYARKSLEAGKDSAAADHLDKADAFLARASHVQTLAAVAAPDEPLSTDASVAQGQLLARIGVAPDASWPTIKAAASEEQARELVLLGVAGQPGTYADADYSLVEHYFEPTSPPDEESGLRSWAPKPEFAIVNIWADANPDSK
jgi:hypothetical protein